MQVGIEPGLREAMQANEKIVAIYLGNGAEKIEHGTRAVALSCEPRQAVGVASGMGLYGLVPVLCLSQEEFLADVPSVLRSGIAQLRYQTGGQFTNPILIVVEYDGALVAENTVIGTPGLRVFAPAIESDYLNMLDGISPSMDPTVIFRPKNWPEWTEAQRARYESAPLDFKPFAIAEGEFATIISFGSATSLAAAAANVLAGEGKPCTVLDVRSLWPYNRDAILASVRTTGRAVIVHDGPRAHALGAELAALLAEEAIESLLAPVRRVSGMDLPPIAVKSDLSRPDLLTIVEAVRSLVDFS